MEPVIDHIEITVRNVVSYEHPRLGFAITSPRAAFAADEVHRRRPGALHHLAFKAGSRAEVDRLHKALVAIGASIVEAPREHPEYTPAGYYALYFKDPDGIKYEVVCCEDPAATEPGALQWTTPGMHQ